ncbi:MAG: efflux RND transporter permease subunit [Melioribacteraceae bacterium]|nr:efflux RND transporter permease subunit [Melioribacteraceae bacterium]
MRLPKFAIENHQFTAIVILLLVLSGIVSFVNMPRSEDPQVAPPASSIITIYPGANPSDLEELVLDPIEEVLNELEDIKEIRSIAQDGLAIVEIEFVTGSNSDDKYSDVVQNVNSIRTDLPEDILSLDIIKWSVSDVNILQIGLVSETAEYFELEDEAERLKSMFERVPGVKSADAIAFPEREVRVSLDMEKAAQMNIPFNQILQIVQTSNFNIPGGSVDIGSKRFNVQTSGSYKNLDEIRNTVIKGTGDQIIYLKDVAEVTFDYEDKKYHARYQNVPAVWVIVKQKPGTNIYDVSEGLKSELEKFSENLSPNIEIATIFDQSDSVKQRLNGFFANLMQGLFLVGIVVFVAVGWRPSIIVMLAIPISIFIGIGLLDFSDFGIEQMSIAGLVIALGLLVDNAIVVTENISRFMREGFSPLEAAVKGTAQIAWAIVSSTATTVLAFVPIILMQNITGEFIRSMPTTVVYTLGASLLVSLTLTPYLSSRYIKIKSGAKDKNESLSPFGRLMQKFIEGHYRDQLAFALKKPWLIVVIAVVVFLGSMTLFPLVGVSFFPKADKPIFLININTPSGSSLDRTDEAAAYVESVLNRNEEIKHYATNIGKSNPRIYYNAIGKHEMSNHAQIFAEVKELDLEKFYKMVDDLRAEFSTYAGAKIEVKVFEQGPPVEAPIAIRLIGENLEQLEKLSMEVENIFRQTEGVININNPLSTSKTDLFININREKAGLLGVQLAEIDRTIRAGIAGLNISTYQDLSGKKYDVIIRLPIDEKSKVTDFKKIYVSSVTGAQIPLEQLATIEFKATPMQINHYNLERNVIITADVQEGMAVYVATNSITSELDKLDWNKDYRYYIAGELESREESFGGMMQAIIIALVGIFAVLVLQFRSYSQPLIVFSAIPLALIGSIIALLLTGYSFSFTAFVGLTSLVGIVVNNSIILVDFTNQLRAEGKELIEALKEACETRFTPIVLTTATTICGLLPLTVIGGSMWAPMGWTIIGGLLVSTFLTLLVVPVLYKIFTK